VDEILGYLLDDLDALKACSLTCKCLFGAIRPLIHQRLVCLDTRPRYPKPKRSLFSRLRKDPGAFERLADAGRSGVLRYTRHLTFKPTGTRYNPPFYPKHLQEYLPQLRSITKLDSLTLEIFCLPSFTPVFDKYFGIFANTLRRLEIREANCPERALLYFISKFPLLEDLTLVSPGSGGSAIPPVPAITQSPPFRGKLVLVKTHSRELFEALAAFPDGLNFRSLELTSRYHLQAILVACGCTAASISYLWPPVYDGSESDPYSGTNYDVTVGYCSHYAGPRAKRGARKIRIDHRDNRPSKGRWVDPLDSPNNNFAPVQRIRDLVLGLGGFPGPDGWWRLEPRGHVADWPCRTQSRFQDRIQGASRPLVFREILAIRFVKGFDAVSSFSPCREPV